jgi:hypothetical protein
MFQKFIALMDGLLESNLAAIGVSDEQFLAACEKGATQAANKLIFGQILAVNDFLSKTSQPSLVASLSLSLSLLLLLAAPHTFGLGWVQPSRK